MTTDRYTSISRAWYALDRSRATSMRWATASQCATRARVYSTWARSVVATGRVKVTRLVDHRKGGSVAHLKRGSALLEGNASGDAHRLVGQIARVTRRQDDGKSRRVRIGLAQVKQRRAVLARPNLYDWPLDRAGLAAVRARVG